MSGLDCELEVKVALMGAQMNTMQADLSATLKSFEANMERSLAAAADRNATAMERMSAASDRMATSRWWQTAAILGGMAIFTAIIIAAVGWMLQFALSASV